MKRSMLVMLTGFMALAASLEARAEVQVDPRHMMILQGGVDEIDGTYLFAVDNPEKTPQKSRITVALPKETVDFRAEEGVQPQDLQLGTQGALVIDKAFDPGTNLLAIGFLVKARYGKATLTVAPPEGAVPELHVLAAKGTLGLEGVGASAIEPMQMGGQTFAQIAFKGVSSASPAVVSVGNVPQGRSAFWLVGGIVGGLLALLGALFTFVTRPKPGEVAQEVF